MTEPTDDETPFESLEGLDELLAYLLEERGFDFSGYKRNGLERRLGKRAHTLGLATFLEYVDYLQVHPDEFGNLFNTILINATSFFRDPIAWDYVSEQVATRLIEAKKNTPLRIWSAGCATGQEAYTLAMVLANALGDAAYSRWVKIYATDVDGDALTHARQAIYSAKEVAGVPPAYLEKYFEPAGARYAFDKDLRRAVIFGQHNLLNDAPISRVDLLLCRNTLMYFNAESQARILASLHFGLNETGVLFLGKAEMLLSHNSLFTPLDLKRRLFSKVRNGYARSRSSQASAAFLRIEDRTPPRTEQSFIREVAFEGSPIAQLGFNSHGQLAAANEHARATFGILPSDLGRAVGDMALGRKLDRLRSLMDQAVVGRRPAQLSGVEWSRVPGEVQFFDVLAAPLVDDEGAHGVQLSFLEATVLRKLQIELQRAHKELDGAHEALQSTSEELETTNEELQSTVEELETTNEELQSTNEELETTNEELQSTNEELQGMNEELRIRSQDLNKLNLYFESILASLVSAVVVLDLELHVQVWSDRAYDMWGLRADEVRDKHVLNLDIGLPIDKLVPSLRACLSGDTTHQELSFDATNRRGRAITCRVVLNRLQNGSDVQGVILLMDERDAPTVKVEARPEDGV